MNSDIEQCCLTHDDSDEFDTDYSDSTNEVSKKVEQPICKDAHVTTLQTATNRERKFFKSSRKPCRNSKTVIQEPKIDNKEVLNITNELFYPDCDISKIMNIEDGEIKIKREWKKMFKVVEHVRQSHLIQEIGEDQEVKDDLEYLIDGILDHTMSVKVQSALRLVKRSTAVEFRSYLRNKYSVIELLNIFEQFQSNQKISLCFCCLMIILMKSELHKEDNSFLIGHLVTWHDLKYPIPDRETWKMVEQLRDFCNGVKGKKNSVVENMTLANKDIRVSALTELLVFMMMSRDDRYFENSDAVKLLASSVKRYIHDIEITWGEEVSVRCDLFCGLHARLALLSKWFQLDEACSIGEFISKNVIEDMLRVCSLFIQQMSKSKNPRESSDGEIVDAVVAVLQCLGVVVLKGIHHHLSAFQDNFLDRLLQFVLFLSLNDEPRSFDLTLLSLELSINLVKADEDKFGKTFTDNLSLGRPFATYKTCKSGVECLAKLFQKLYKSLSAGKTVKRSSKRLKDTKVSRGSTDKIEKYPMVLTNMFDATNNSLNVTNNNSSFYLSLNIQDIEGSMNSFIISSYVVVLIGILISWSPELMTPTLRFLPDKSFRGAYCLLKEFLEFMTDCNSYQCHEQLQSIVDILKSFP